MITFFTLGLSAFLICLVTTPLCRDLFLRLGLVDRPDSDRKFHLRAVPRIGGVPIVLSYLGALLLALLCNIAGGKIYIQHEHLFKALLPAAALIFATGLLDDLVGLRPRHKLLGQTAAAILAVSLGVRLSMCATHPWLGGLLSVCWLVGCSNAVNLIDGMDGLAAGVGLLATVTTLLVALLSGNVGLALATIPLAGCLLAFLCYNFSPATVFLGDCGSLTIGFVLGCFSLIWSQHNGTLLGIMAPLMALALPLIDVGLAIGRRYLRAVPLFQGDRGHIHHMVLNLGFSTRNAALLLYGVCILCASLALLTNFSAAGMRWPIVILFCCLVMVGIDRLGYVEFNAARRALSHTAARRAISDEIYLHELTLALNNADSVAQWWLIAREAFLDLGFATVDLEIYGHAFREHFHPAKLRPSCRIHLDLGEQGFITLTRMPEQASPRAMMAVLRQLQLSIEERPLLSEFTAVEQVSSVVSSHAA